MHGMHKRSAQTKRIKRPTSSLRSASQVGSVLMSFSDKSSERMFLKCLCTASGTDVKPAFTSLSSVFSFIHVLTCDQILRQ